MSFDQRLLTIPVRVLATGIGVVMSAGCQPPDRWSAFDRPAATRHAVPDVAVPVRQLAFEDQASADSALGSLFVVPASGPIELTVEQAALAALQRNPDLRVERFNVPIAATFESIERGVFDPEIFAGAQYLEDEGTEISRATGSEFTTTRREATAEAGVRQTLPTGTEIEVGVSTERSTSNRAPEQQVARVGLTVTQSLLQGFGPAVNLARVRQAELDTSASLFELQAFTEALLADTETTYWLYSLAARRMEIFEESLDLARRQREEVRDRIEIGVLPETERASADAEVAQREQDLINARADLSTLRLQLVRLIGGRDSDLVERNLVVVSEPATETSPLDDVTARIELAIRDRSDLNEARLQLEQRRLETIITRNGVLPRLDFFIALGQTGYASELSESFRQLDASTYDLTAGLDFSYPLGNREASALNRAAGLQRRQAAEAVRNLESLIRQEVRIAAVEVERAREQISASAATRRLREEALRAEEERFRVGNSTSLLVAQAQRDLLESQIAEVDAVVAYRIALIALHRAEGTLLTRHGLLVE